MTICEGIHGTFYYHWSPNNGRSALCNAKVMPTQVPAEAWGTVSHLGERYCPKCAELIKLRKA